MAAPFFDSDYLYGFHDPGGESIMLEAGRPGWIIFTEALGGDPNDFSGADYRLWSGRGLGVISRLNYGYYPNGTIPYSDSYINFARRCANFVANSQGCAIWIIGNEMNLPIERPLAPGFRRPFPAPPSIAPSLPSGQPRSDRSGEARGSLRSAAERAALLRPQPLAPTPSARAALGAGIIDGFQVITPDLYAQCYRLCRQAIRSVPGHANDQVLIGAIGPWNNLTQYFGNENGDWVRYFEDILALLGPSGVDGIALHTYTHDADPALITATVPLAPPFQNRQFEFRTYRDFMMAIPADMRRLPVYITETNQVRPWLDANIGWVQAAYVEIDSWNRQAGNQQIRSLALYRWPPYDDWVIEGRLGVIEDLRAALQFDFKWNREAAELLIAVGSAVTTLSTVRLRRTPGFVGKSANDVLSLVAQDRNFVVASGPTNVDGLLWWQVRGQAESGVTLDGWMAERAPTGVRLLRAIASSSLPPGQIVVGGQVTTLTRVRMRRTPGFASKPPSDILTEVPANVPLLVNDGPRRQDRLNWWLVTGIFGNLPQGWVAETTPEGVRLLNPAAAPPDVPNVSLYQSGDLIVAAVNVRVRRTPGVTNKALTDVLGEFTAKTTLNIIAGPQVADNLNWWQVGGITRTIGEAVGWVAEVAPSGVTLIQAASQLPNTTIPDKVTKSYLGAPFEGVYSIAQLWGENPQIYSQFTYDGVPLLGHNGIDFLTPSGVNILAVDNGVVDDVRSNDPGGFGTYIKVRHSWGEALYAHLLRADVQVGQLVQRGANLGQTGNTGFSQGPHLHFAIRINPYVRSDGWGGFSDPLPYLLPQIVKLPAWVLPPLTPTTLIPRAGRQRIPGVGYAPERPGVRRP